MKHLYAGYTENIVAGRGKDNQILENVSHPDGNW
jgi:hypothetical protein